MVVRIVKRTPISPSETWSLCQNAADMVPDMKKAGACSAPALNSKAARLLLQAPAPLPSAAEPDPLLRSRPLRRVTFDGFFAEGYVLAAGSEAEAALGRAHRGATGEELQSFMSPSYLDTRVYALYDRVPALCYGPVSRNIHGFDERVSLASVQRITTAIALFVAEWCGTESRTSG